MKHYFIAENEIQTGPFNFEEVLAKKITKTTLIWSEGFDDWIEAINVEELQNILIAEPPPIPKKIVNNEEKKVENLAENHIELTNEVNSLEGEYDNSYTNEKEFTFFGIGLCIATIILNTTFKVDENNHQMRLALIFFSLVIRIAVLVNVKKVAERQNRDSNAWAVFGFIFPSLALIIIGQLKKLKLDISSNILQSNQNQNLLFKNAKKLNTLGSFEESIKILDLLVENDSKNFEYLKYRAQVLFDSNNLVRASYDFERLIKNDKYCDYAYNNLGEIAIINKNKELAINYWLKAKELYSSDAIKNLNIYFTYENQYILNSLQTIQKTQKNSNSESTYFLDGKYLEGLIEIDNYEIPNSLSTRIGVHDMGISIELAKSLKTYYIAISYYEIDNIFYNTTEKKFKLILNDKKELAFEYDNTKDINNGLLKLHQRFDYLIGKKTDFNVKEK